MADQLTGTKNSSGPSFSRRKLLIGAAGLTFALSLGLKIEGAYSLAADDRHISDAWVTIGTDGTITIAYAVDEIGQGTSTALPLVFADELGADWDDVVVVPSPADDKLYGNPSYGVMMTGGSAAISGYFTSIRIQAAQIRTILHNSVAAKWDVPASELSEKPSQVVHKKTGRKISFAQIAGFAHYPVDPPKITENDLKPWSEFRYIGKDMPRVDLPAKVNGTAEFSIDVRLEGMLYGMVLRAPIEGSRPVKVFDAKASMVPGFVKTVTLPYGVGILAETMEAALAAKASLEVEWSAVKGAGSFNSENALELYAKAANDLSIKGDFAHTNDFNLADPRNIYKALNEADTVFEGHYSHDYTYHAQIEPLNAVVALNKAGDGADVWVGTQSPTFAVAAAAKALNLAEDRINLHRSFSGGGFGRRNHEDQEYTVDAALLAKASRRPVKCIWSREDDVHNGRFRPLTAHTIRAGFDRDGKFVALHHRIASETALAFSHPSMFKAFGSRPFLSINGSNIDYNIPNFLAEHINQVDGMRLAPVRGTSVTTNNFAVESFMDEIALKKEIDPLDFRLGMLRKDPRALAVLNKVAEMSAWRQGAEKDRALGVGFVHNSGSYMASIAEVSLDRDSGKIKVHNIWGAIDPGLAVQPDSVVAQIEGGIIYGLGVALSERITMKDGVVQQSNFYDYFIPRMSDIPDIHVEVLSTGNKPGGAGEMGVTMGVAPVANAIAALTGVRLRKLPMTPKRVLEALVEKTKQVTSMYKQARRVT